MGIKMDAQCLLCQLQRNIETARSLGSEEKAAAFTREFMQAVLDQPETVSAPELSPITAEMLTRYYGLDPDRFQKEKDESNEFVLSRLPEIEKKGEQAKDPILAGLQFAILGNYIDFSALRGKVSFQELDGMLEKALTMEISQENLKQLKQDLKTGRRLLYITDNAGEICFDRVFAQQIKKAYPQLEITFCVRGGPALNDATRQDAKLAKIPFPVVDSGCTVPGTVLRLLSGESRQALQNADVVIAKGQGNVETMYGCGHNVYYAFLVKCARFQRIFNQPQFTPMLVRDCQCAE